MKKTLVLFLVAAVLFSSGCVELEGLFGETETVSTGSGVIVNEFEPDFPDLEPGDSFDLFLEVENIGGSDASDTYAHLYNIDYDKWSIDETADEQMESLGTLDMPDISAGIPGDIQEATWEMEAPTVPEGVVFEYTPKVRLMYGYQTVASATIPLMEKSEYKRLKERDMLNVPDVVTDVSKGPVSVEVSSRSPIVIDDYDEDTVDFRVKVNLLQQGGLFDPDHNTDNMTLDADEMDVLDITIDADGIDSVIDCDAYGAADTESLRRGKTLDYSCELKANTFSASASVPITITLDYNYYRDLETDIKVTARD